MKGTSHPNAFGFITLERMYEIKTPIKIEIAETKRVSLTETIFNEITYVCTSTSVYNV